MRAPALALLLPLAACGSDTDPADAPASTPEAAASDASGDAEADGAARAPTALRAMH